MTHCIQNFILFLLSLFKYQYLEWQFYYLLYIKLDSDPFVLVPIKKLVKKKLRKPEKIEPKEQLNFVVNGVIVNDKSKTLLIIDQTNNQTVFLKEGMEYKTIKVVSISATEIKISEQNQVRTVSVNN